MDEVVERFEESRISLPTGQIKPGKANLFGQAEPSADRHDIYDGDGNRRYVMFAFVIATDRDGTVREREEFKIPGMTRQEGIRAQGKRFTLPFYTTFGLLAAPPLEKRCRRAPRSTAETATASLAQKEENCPVLTPGASTHYAGTKVNMQQRCAPPLTGDVQPASSEATTGRQDDVAKWQQT
jgi:hypothetical protein